MLKKLNSPFLTFDLSDDASKNDRTKNLYRGSGPHAVIVIYSANGENQC